MSHIDDPEDVPSATIQATTIQANLIQAGLPAIPAASPSQPQESMAEDAAGGIVPQDILEEATRRCKSTVVADMARKTTLTHMIEAYHRYARTSEHAFRRMYKRRTVPLPRKNGDDDSPEARYALPPSINGHADDASLGAFMDTNASYIAAGRDDPAHPDYREKEEVAAQMHEERREGRDFLDYLKRKMTERGLLTPEQEGKYYELMQPPHQSRQR